MIGKKSFWCRSIQILRRFATRPTTALHDYQQSLGRSCVQIVFECETAVQNNRR